MSNRGMAMMGVGYATGDDRAKKAVEMALSSPLLDDIELHGARGLLVNVTCDESLTMEEYQLINERVHEIASDEADAKCGMSVNPGSNGELRVTVVATGLQGSKALAQPVVQSHPKVTQFIKPELQMPHIRAADIEKPTYIREQEKRRVMAAGGSPFPIDVPDDILNIPAFLRNQAD
jgi:cell division protein FtsZ